MVRGNIFKARKFLRSEVSNKRKRVGKYSRSNSENSPLPIQIQLSVMRCAIWYHLYNLKNVKNTHGVVLLLVLL